jgi:hypothetical protein
MYSESRNALETAMVDAGEGALIGGGIGGALRSTPRDMGVLGRRMLGRLAAGSTLAEVAADEGLAPRRARELLAEAVARRGYDP